MTQEEINQIIENYNALENHTTRVIDKLEKLDGKMYNTARFIEKITYDDIEVCVECDDSYCGDSDTHYFSFPLSFLSMSDAELEQGVLAEKAKREEKERIEKQKELEDKRLKQERSEKQMLERLKKKYE